jgi:hypothetical protein
VKLETPCLTFLPPHEELFLSMCGRSILKVEIAQEESERAKKNQPGEVP